MTYASKEQALQNAVRLMQDGALGEGADAYLEKGDDEGLLLEAIRTVVART